MKTDINRLHGEWFVTPPNRRDQLYSELGEAVYEYVQRIIKREFSGWYRVLQQDAAQEAALEVFKDIPKFDPVRGDFEQWVYGVTCHTCVDILRQRRNQNTWSLLDHEALAPHSNHLAKNMLQVLRRDLGEEEDTLLGWQLDGHSHSQIAEKLGCSEATARQRWHRLCLKLRTLRGGMENTA